MTRACIAFCASGSATSSHRRIGVARQLATRHAEPAPYHRSRQRIALRTEIAGGICWMVATCRTLPLLQLLHSPYPIVSEPPAAGPKGEAHDGPSNGSAASARRFQSARQVGRHRASVHVVALSHRLFNCRHSHSTGPSPTEIARTYAAQRLERPPRGHAERLAVRRLEAPPLASSEHVRVCSHSAPAS
jgi:hypothetical protein